MIARECYAAKAEAGLFTSRAVETAAALRHICGFGVLGDQEVVAVFAGLDLCSEPERHAAAAGPDLVGISGIAILGGDVTRLGVSAASAVCVAADFQKLRELRLQLLASFGDFRAIMASTSARRLSSLPVSIFSNIIAISHRSHEERRA